MAKKADEVAAPVRAPVPAPAPLLEELPKRPEHVQATMCELWVAGYRVVDEHSKLMGNIFVSVDLSAVSGFPLTFNNEIRLIRRDKRSGIPSLLQELHHSLFTGVLLILSLANHVRVGELFPLSA